MGSGNHTHPLREVRVSSLIGKFVDLPSTFRGYGYNPDPEYIEDELIYISNNLGDIKLAKVERIPEPDWDNPYSPTHRGRIL